MERAGPDSVGVDFGLSNLIALSNRETVERPRWVTRAERELRRRQRQLARCKRTSKTRSKRKAALAKFQGRVTAKRRDHLHKVARNLVTRFGAALQGLPFLAQSGPWVDKRAGCRLA